MKTDVKIEMKIHNSLKKLLVAHSCWKKYNETLICVEQRLVVALKAGSDRKLWNMTWGYIRRSAAISKRIPSIRVTRRLCRLVIPKGWGWVQCYRRQLMAQSVLYRLWLCQADDASPSINLVSICWHLTLKMWNPGRHLAYIISHEDGHGISALQQRPSKTALSIFDDLRYPREILQENRRRYRASSGKTIRFDQFAPEE